MRFFRPIWLILALGLGFSSLQAQASIVFTNLDAGAPNTFEACVNSQIRITYSGFAAHPTQVRLLDTLGFDTLIPVTPTGMAGTAGNRSGQFLFNIPANAGTGPLSIFNLGTNLFTSLQYLVVHNPNLQFGLAKPLLCSEDNQIALWSYPSGGGFQASYTLPFVPQAALINSVANPNLFLVRNLNLDSTHNDTLIHFRYNFTPQYIGNNTPCLQPVSRTQSQVVYDNRLQQVIFDPIVIVGAAPPPNAFSRLDTLRIDSLFLPRIDTNVHTQLTFSYAGAFVINDQTRQGDFLYGLSGFGRHRVQVSYNNRGCIANATTDVEVVPPLQIPGLPDTLCREANPLSFFRDSSYRDTLVRDTLRDQANRITQINTIRRGRLMGAPPTNPSSTAGTITQISTVVNNEHYRFDPSTIPVGTPSVTVSMEYTLFTTITYCNVAASNNEVNCTPQGANTVVESKIPIRKNIVISERPYVRIDSTLRLRYCHDATPIQLQSTPSYEWQARTRYRLRDFFNNGIDSLLPGPGDVFDFNMLYTRRVPLANRDLEFEMIYIIDKYGCLDYDTVNLIIVAPVRPQFIGRHPVTKSYCFNELEDDLIANPSFSSGFPGTGYSGAGMGLNNDGTVSLNPRRFAPQQAGAGSHPITYTYVDSVGCVSQITDTFLVRAQSQARLETADLQTAYCASVNQVTLRLVPIGSTSISLVTFFGQSVTDSTFSPSARFGGGAGTAFVYVDYRDGFGCRAFDTMQLDIYPVPVLNLSGLNPAYCANLPRAQITLSPDHTTGNGGVLSGTGVLLQDGLYYFDPEAVNTMGNHTLTYSYRNSFNCLAVLNRNVRVDSVPVVSLQGLDSVYCENYSPDTLLGFPNPATSLGTGIYGGPGIGVSSGVFRPNQAGTGQVVLSYTFIDSRGCQNTIEDTTFINTLPDALFTGLLPEYCIDAPDDTLRGLDTTGTGFFVGNAVFDSLMGIIRPRLDSAGLRQITYVYTDINNCTNSSTQNFFIQPLPAVSIAGLDDAYCQNSPEGRVIGVPVGGTFTGNRTNTGLSFIAAGVESFTPSVADTGQHRFIYRYENPISGCVNFDTVFTLVFPSYTPTISGLPSSYCEIRDTMPLTAMPSGGIFTGNGILAGTSSFLPTLAGTGTHGITYTKTDVFPYGSGQSITCSNESVRFITINPQPVAQIIQPLDNSNFCSNDTTTMVLTGAIVNDTARIPRFTSSTGAVFFRIDTFLNFSNMTFYFDTTYLFRPSLAGQGTHRISYRAFNDFGCVDSLTHTVVVNPSPVPTFTPLQAAYCENDPAIALVGSPLGGVFIRNSDTLQSPIFMPSPTYPNQLMTGPSADTIRYYISLNNCDGFSDQFVVINPKPDASFVSTRPDNRYCLVTDSIPLIPVQAGGNFFGSGVVFGSYLFAPMIAGVGVHEVFYQYEDPITGCRDQTSDTFWVFTQPSAHFTLNGSCQDQALSFYPSNDSLGLTRFFQGLYDSLTQVRWTFGTGTTPIQLPGLTRHLADSIQHLFPTTGAYEVELYVENQFACVDSFQLRVVVAPKIDQFPYVQTFDNGPDGWIAEDRGSRQSTLWEWSIPSDPQGIDAVGVGNATPMWATAPGQSPTPGIDAWVYSPCFDLTSLDRPMMAFDFWSHSENSLDGAVVEYRDHQGRWRPLGELNRGINWYNTPIVVGTPGDQDLAPRGWTGYMSDFANARYKLDEIRYNPASANTLHRNFQFRVAFGASPVPSAQFSDGFAFDNVWIGNRSRNVLLEHVSNVGASGMNATNNHVYNLCFRTPLVRDVVLLQYQLNEPAQDEFYRFNEANHNARRFFYGFSLPGYSVIDGIMANNLGLPSQQLSQSDFEHDMLEDPKFSIQIHNFQFLGRDLVADVSFEALDTMPQTAYKLRLAVVEDTLDYISNPGSRVHAVLRQLMPADGFTYNQAFLPGQGARETASWSAISLGLNPARLSLVAFVQDDSTKQVYQVASTRDLSYFINLLGTDKQPSAEALAQAETLNSLRLYPNPAQDYFQVDLEQALEEDLTWELFDLNGRALQLGQWPQGQTQIQVQTQDLPGGMYIFRTHNGQFAVQRQVIIRR